MVYNLKRGAVMPKTIGNWMKKDVVAVQADANLLEAARILAEKRVGTLPVVDGQGNLIGLTSMRKVVRFFLPDFINVIEDVDFVKDFGAIEMPNPIDIEKASSTRVSEVMEEAVSVDDDCSLMRALALMVTHDILDLPVVHEGKLVGIASRVDIGRAFLESWLNDYPKTKSKRS
jgi:CBS domain-containing protein